MTSPTNHKFSIYARGGLGDILRGYFGRGDGWEYLKPLKKKYPHAIVKLVVQSQSDESARFFTHHPLIDQIIVGPWAHPGRPLKRLEDDDHTLITKISGLEVDLCDEIYLSEEDKQLIASVSGRGKYILVHPFSTRPGRMAMPIKEYFPLVSALGSMGVNTVVVGANWTSKRWGKFPPTKHVEEFPFRHENLINLIDKSSSRAVAKLLFSSVCPVVVNSYCMAMTVSCDRRPAMLIPDFHPQRTANRYRSAMRKFSWVSEARIVVCSNHNKARQEIIQHVQDELQRQGIS